MLLVSAHGCELLLLHDLHEALLQRLSHEHLEDGLHLEVEVEEIALLDLGNCIYPCLLWDVERRRRAVHEQIRLGRHLHLRHNIRQLLQV